MSHFTEPAIKAAFLKLLDEKSLSRITVKDIADEAGINRNSFYYHYQDIPTLMKTIFEEETEKLFEAYPSIETFPECAKYIIDYAAKNKRLILHIFNSSNQSLILDSFMVACQETADRYMDVSIKPDAIRPEDRPVISRFFRCIMFGMIINWIKDGMNDEASDILKRMIELSEGVPELIASNSLKHTSDTP